MAHKIMASWLAVRCSYYPAGAPVLGDPGEGPFYHPAAGQDLEGVPVALGDDLDVHAQGGGPGGQLAGVSRIAERHASSPARHQQSKHPAAPIYQTLTKKNQVTISRPPG
jgi:hypothetical protein